MWLEDCHIMTSAEEFPPFAEFDEGVFEEGGRSDLCSASTRLSSSAGSYSPKCETPWWYNTSLLPTEVPSYEIFRLRISDAYWHGQYAECVQHCESMLSQQAHILPNSLQLEAMESKCRALAKQENYDGAISVGLKLVACSSSEDHRIQGLNLLQDVFGWICQCSDEKKLTFCSFRQAGTIYIDLLSRLLNRFDRNVTLWLKLARFSGDLSIILPSSFGLFAPQPSATAAAAAGLVSRRFCAACRHLLRIAVRIRCACLLERYAKSSRGFSLQCNQALMAETSRELEVLLCDVSIGFLPKVDFLWNFLGSDLTANSTLLVSTEGEFTYGFGDTMKRDTAVAFDADNSDLFDDNYALKFWKKWFFCILSDCVECKEFISL